MRQIVVATVLAMGLGPGLCGPALADPPSGIYTGDAQQITDTTARLPGYVGGTVPNPVPPATCWFEYGTAAAYGNRVDVVCAGTTYAYLTQLQPGTLYHYVFAGANAPINISARKSG